MGLEDWIHCNWLVVKPTRLKNMLVKLGIFPKGGENKEYVKPPPR